MNIISFNYICALQKFDVTLTTSFIDGSFDPWNAHALGCL